MLISLRDKSFNLNISSPPQSTFNMYINPAGGQGGGGPSGIPKSMVSVV